MTDAPETAAPVAPTAAEDVAILFPDREVPVRDPDSGETVTVTVREYRMLDGLRAQALGRPLIEELAGLADAVEGDAAPGLAAFDAVLGAHADIWLELTALATGRDAAWLGRLGSVDGDTVSLAMIEANAGFFIDRMARHAMGAPELERMFRSLKSSTNLSGPATAAATPTSPAASPGARSSGSGTSPRSAGRKFS